MKHTIPSRFSYPNQRLWDPYLDNNKNGSIGLDSTDVDISNFINNIGEPHPTCRQCPNKENLQVIDHLKTVEFRNKYTK